MLLKEKLLEDFTKEEMLGVAKHLGLNKVSSLKKDALIEKIVERFCSEDELRRRMACRCVHFGLSILMKIRIICVYLRI